MNSNTPSTLQQQAREFRKSYRIPNSKTVSQRSVQKDLIVEEFKEFLEAEGELWHRNPTYPSEALKELADLVYVTYHKAVTFGRNLDEAVRRVHASNMSKLDEEGEPIFREDGKVMKGPNYKEPNLSDLI